MGRGLKILGVDLGHYSIKIAELDSTGKGFTFTNFHEFPLSQDPNRDRGLEIIEVLRNFSSRVDPANTRWVLGIPQSSVATHQKRFPFRERQKILKSLPFELEEDIPFDIDDTIFDAKIIEYLGTMSNVLTVAVPKESVQEILSVAKDGGFEPTIVSPEGLAFANLFEHWAGAAPEVPLASREPAEEGTPLPVTHSRLVLNLGYSHSLLLVYRESGLVTVRSLMWGGNDLAQALVSAFNIPNFEAIKILNSKAYILMNSAGASREQLLLSQTISSSVDELLRDLRLTLIETKAAYNLDFTRIDLTGGLSSIQNLGPYITQSLEIPANPLPMALGEIATRFPVTPEVEAVCGVALGLAIEGLKRGRNPTINLRQGDFALENLSLKNFWETWRTTVQIAIAAFVIFTVYSFVRDSVTSTLDSSADDKLTDAAQKILNMKTVSDASSSLNKYITTQKSLIKTREAYAQIEDYVPALDLIAKLSEKLPVLNKVVPGQGLDVSTLTIDNDDAHIEGFTHGATTPQQIEKALSDVARPKSVTKGPSMPTAGAAKGGAPFSFNFKINRKP